MGDAHEGIVDDDMENLCEQDDECSEGEGRPLLDLTLDNFDESEADGPILTSPRSIEACRILGIDPEELVQRPIKYFLRSNEEPAMGAKRAARYERMRLSQLDKARVLRLEIIDAEMRGTSVRMPTSARSRSRSPDAGMRPKSASRAFGSAPSSVTPHESTTVSREKREIERMQYRQALEMQQMMNFELQMAELERDRDRREAAKKRQDELAVKERIRHQRQVDDARRRKEIEKAEQSRIELEITRREVQQQQLEMRRREERAKQEADQQRRELQKTERERLRRQEESRQQAELYTLVQEREAVKREQEIARREARMQEQLEQQKRAKAEELAEKQERNRQRMLQVLGDKEFQRAQQLEAAARKQRESEERRQQVEAERKQRDEELHQQARRKKETIEMVQNQLALMEQQRRGRLLDQERQVAERLEHQERERIRERKAQRREEQRLAEERQHVYQRMEERLREKQSVYYQKMEQKAAIAKAMQENKRALVRERLQDAKLREEEIQTALIRRQKQDEYRTNVLLSRIESDDTRARQLKEQREALIRRRQLIKQSASRQKHEILESFHRMRVTKKYKLPKHLVAAVTAPGERPRSASSVLETRRFTATDARPPARKSSARMVSRPRPASAGSKSNSREKAQSPSTTDDDDDEENDTDTERDTGGNEPPKRQNCSLEEYESEIDDLRRKQNAELLHVLEEEHHAEEQRDHLLRQVTGNASEYSRLEHIFGKERAQASDRIMKLTERHEVEMAARMQELVGPSSLDH